MKIKKTFENVNAVCYEVTEFKATRVGEFISEYLKEHPDGRGFITIKTDGTVIGPTKLPEKWLHTCERAHFVNGRASPIKEEYANGIVQHVYLADEWGDIHIFIDAHPNMEQQQEQKESQAESIRASDERHKAFERKASWLKDIDRRFEALNEQARVLRELSPQFGGRTLDNVLQNIESSIRELSRVKN